MTLAEVLGKRKRPQREDRGHGRTPVLVLLAVLVLLPLVGLVSSRPRGAVPVPQLPVVSPEHEPPPSSLPSASERTVEPPRPLTRVSLPATEEAGRAIEELRPASRPSETKLARLEIRVSDAGRAAGGAWIELAHEASSAAEATVTVARAGEDGRLTLELEPGVVRACAWSESATALPQKTRLEPEKAATLELALEPAFPVAGRVIDESSGQPVADAAVSIWTFAERDVVRTRSDGTFRHPRFPARAPSQQIAVRAAGYGGSVRYLRIGADGRWKLPAATSGDAALEGSGLPWVEIALVPELRVRGQVLDERGQPVFAARVSAEGFFHALPSVASRDRSETASTRSGDFELAGLRSDIGHSLLIEAPGFARAVLELDGVAGLFEANAVVLVRECVLAGVVIDALGLPVADVEVVLHPTALQAPAPHGFLDVGARVESGELRTRTSPEGTFVFEHLAAQPVTVLVRGDGGAEAREELQPRPDGSFDSPALVLVRPSYALAQEPERSQR